VLHQQEKDNEEGLSAVQQVMGVSIGGRAGLQEIHPLHVPTS
jgi:hypothetical protein